MHRPGVWIERTRLEVEPGATVSTAVVLHNSSEHVEEYDLSVLGVPGTWAVVAPARVSLMPGARAHAQVTFAPTTGPTAPVGPFAFGLRCVSTVDSQDSAVAEGDIDVGAVRSVSPDLVVVTGTGRWRGRYRVDVTNAGTVPVHVGLAATAATEALSMALQPNELEVPAGATRCSYLMVRPRAPGGTAPLPHPFSVDWRTDEASGQLNGTFTQRPVLPRRGLAALAVVLVTLVAAVVGLRALVDRQASPAAQAPIAPEAPRIRSVDAVPEGLRIRWSSVDAATSYEVRMLDRGDVVDNRKAESVQTAMVWKGAPQGGHCFVVVAATGGATSDPSAPRCGQSLAPLAAATASKVLLVYATIPTADVNTYARALATQKRIASKDPRAQVALNTDVPAVAARGGVPSYVVFSDGFPDEAAARAACPQVRDVAPSCVVVPPLGSNPS
jgi:hypothetical protein